MAEETNRKASTKRKTGETDVFLGLDLDAPGAEISTGVGFFDHMLDSLARHSGIGLEISAKGDLETGSHHTVEDVGIAFGQTLDQALADRAGINRFGWALVPMDEALASCAIDLSGRGMLVFEGDLPVTEIGGFETELTAEFFGAVARESRMTLHLGIERGSNVHHIIEAVFKAFALSLKSAVAASGSEGIPSTKGTLTS